MDWERDKRIEQFDKAKMERDLAKIDANRRCRDFKKSLVDALQEVRQDPNNQGKIKVLKQLVGFCINWGDSKPNSFADEFGIKDLQEQAREINREFGFSEEAK